MDKKDIRSILSAYRSGESHADDVRFEEARNEAEADPELSQWWREEKELDLIIARKLQGVPVAAGLKERLLRPPEAVVRSPWVRRIALLAAALDRSALRMEFAPPLVADTWKKNDLGTLRRSILCGLSDR